jgi:FKBP-type peptidyl-prolyl cis-trans isomerase 2
MTRTCVQVTKRILQKGKGEFPIDAPIGDATVSIHYSVHRHGKPDEVLYSTRTAGASTAAEGANGNHHTPSGEPVNVSTGDGMLPSGLEMAVKLMLLRERCHVVVHPDFGFRTCVAGVHEQLPRDETLEFDLELVSFEKEMHPEAMNAGQVCFCYDIRPWWIRARCCGAVLESLL